jgi:hypothetical protein
MKKSLIVVLLITMVLFSGCQSNQEPEIVENNLIGIWMEDDVTAVMELTVEGRIVDSGQDVAGYEVLPDNQVKINNGNDEVVISYELDGYILKWGTNFDEYQTFYAKDIYEGKILSISNEYVEVQTSFPNENRVVFIIGDETKWNEVSKDNLVIGRKITVLTKGIMTKSIPPQMPVLEVIDIQENYSLAEEISKYEFDKVLTEEDREYIFDVNKYFAVALDVDDEATEEWIINSDSIRGLELVATTKEENQYKFVFKAIIRGEYYVDYILRDNDTYETKDNFHQQIFVKDFFSTEGNIVEVVGMIDKIEEQTIEISGDNKTYNVYVPDDNLIKDLVIGDKVIAGLELGEASYILKIIEKKINLVVHVGVVEKLLGEQFRVLINDYYLDIYHNDLIDDTYAQGDIVYIEYEADYISEANELRFIKRAE